MDDLFIIIFDHPLTEFVSAWYDTGVSPIICFLKWLLNSVSFFSERFSNPLGTDASYTNFIRLGPFFIKKIPFLSKHENAQIKERKYFSFLL